MSWENCLSATKSQQINTKPPQISCLWCDINVSITCCCYLCKHQIVSCCITFANSLYLTKSLFPYLDTFILGLNIWKAIHTRFIESISDTGVMVCTHPMQAHTVRSEKVVIFTKLQLVLSLRDWSISDSDHAGQTGEVTVLIPPLRQGYWSLCWTPHVPTPHTRLFRIYPIWVSTGYRRCFPLDILPKAQLYQSNYSILLCWPIRMLVCYNL